MPYPELLCLSSGRTVHHLAAAAARAQVAVPAVAGRPAGEMTVRADEAVMTDRVAGAGANARVLAVAMIVLAAVPMVGEAAVMVDVTIEAADPVAAGAVQAAEGQAAVVVPVAVATSSHRSGGPTTVRSPMHNAARQRSMPAAVRRV